jgi:cysteinyl-tRNA synthetase
MIAGARVDVAPYKKEATDFVLWKPSKEGEPGWPSPCGITVQGRPGWHIECSAMSFAELIKPYGGGFTCDDPTKNMFDIHGGGIDLVFPHHENEIAQSCCAFGTPRMANVWMHNGFLQVEGQKMSKSVGNFVTIHELLETEKFGGRTWSGDVLRLAMLRTHYRQPIDFTVKALEECEKTLANWAELAGRHKVSLTSGPVEPALLEALQDDLNTAAAFAVLSDIARKAKINAHDAQQLAYCADFLGLNTKNWFSRAELTDVMSGLDPDLKEKVDSLIAARLDARRNKNFAESDRIRDELVAMNIELKDSKNPATGELETKWEVKR